MMLEWSSGFESANEELLFVGGEGGGEHYDEESI